MITFKDFLLVEQAEVPFDKSPEIGWWKDKAEKDGYHTVYHGTHKKNLAHILKHGLTHKDPKTGMISVTHDPHTAHGYAAMSGSGGESNFRKVGGKAVHTPHEDRVVLKMHIPKDHMHKHMDHTLSGNGPSGAHERMTNKAKYEAHKKAGGHDSEYYMATELRLNHAIDPKHIVGYMHKKK